jgi:hypothetical protein
MMKECVDYFAKDESDIPTIDAASTKAYLDSRTPPKLGPYTIREMFVGSKKMRMQEKSNNKNKSQLTLNNNNNNNYNNNVATNSLTLSHTSNSTNAELSLNQASSNLEDEATMTIRTERIIRAYGISFNPATGEIYGFSMEQIEREERVIEKDFDKYEMQQIKLTLFTPAKPNKNKPKQLVIELTTTPLLLPHLKQVPANETKSLLFKIMIPYSLIYSIWQHGVYYYINLRGYPNAQWKVSQKGEKWVPCSTSLFSEFADKEFTRRPLLILRPNQAIQFFRLKIMISSRHSRAESMD